jgi:hypothetical protein
MSMSLRRSLGGSSARGFEGLSCRMRGVMLLNGNYSHLAVADRPSEL